MSNIRNNKKPISTSKQMYFWILFFSWVFICLLTMGLLNSFFQPESGYVEGHVEEGTEWFEEYDEIRSTLNGRTYIRDEYRCFAYLNYTYSVNGDIYYGSNGQPVEYTLSKSSNSCINHALEYYSSSFNISVWYYPDDPANSRLTEDVEEITDTLVCCCFFQFFIGLFMIYFVMYRINNNHDTPISFDNNSSTTQTMAAVTLEKRDNDSNLVLVIFKKIIGLFLIIFSTLPLYIVYEANTKPTVNAGGDLSIPFTCCGILGVIIGLVLIFSSKRSKYEEVPIVLINEKIKTKISKTDDKLPPKDEWWDTSSENKQ